MLICGFAGSGKTMIAVEKATRLAKQGFLVLLVCYNRFLAQDLRQRLRGLDRLSIATFHEVCLRLSEQAGLIIPEEAAQDSDYYSHFLPNTLLEALSRIQVRYDAIIVDEGQDFLDDWWTPLQLLLADPDQGVLYIFYDDNQCLYGHPPLLPLQGPPYLLTINCRTTKQIHEQIVHFYQGASTPIARGPDGTPVEFQIYERKEVLQETVMCLLLKLTEEHHIPPEAILVLTPYSRKKSWLKAEQPATGPGLDWNPSSPRQARLATIHSFKGLERPVVILVELERWLTQGVKGVELERLLYVGCSRAKNYLLVLLPEKHAQEILPKFQLKQAVQMLHSPDGTEEQGNGAK
jgi:superfamily I DNA/RNA helicase